LLAYDTLSWRAELRDSDARYEVSPTAPGLWRADTVLPASVSRRGLGIDDDLKYRAALRSFSLTQPRNPLAYGASVQSQRAVAQIRLAEVVREDPRARRKAIGANLLGILALSAPSPIAPGQPSPVESATAEFQNAIRLDPDYEDAKFNLELLLRETEARGQREGGDRDQGQAAGVDRRGVGLVAAGRAGGEQPEQQQEEQPVLGPAGGDERVVVVGADGERGCGDSSHG
jgi:hypothetical protein